jgi:hypothetical protein
MSPVTSAQGYMTLGTSGSIVPGGTIQSQSSNYSEQIEIPIVAGMEHSWISKRIGATANQFTPLVGSGVSTSGWTALTVELVSGAASSGTTLDVEFFVNVEGQLPSTSAMAELVPRDPPHNAIATRTSAAIAQKTSSFIGGGVEKVEAMVTKAASDFIGPLLENGAQYLLDALTLV